MFQKKHTKIKIELKTIDYCPKCVIFWCNRIPTHPCIVIFEFQHVDGTKINDGFWGGKAPITATASLVTLQFSETTLFFAWILEQLQLSHSSLVDLNHHRCFFNKPPYHHMAHKTRHFPNKKSKKIPWAQLHIQGQTST